MNALRLLCCLMALAFTAAHAQTPAISDVQEKQSAMEATARGSITAIDPQARTVTIQPETGDGVLTVQARPEVVRNFDQLRVGQTVILNYHRSVAVNLQPAGSAEHGAYLEQQAARAVPGQMPGSIKANVLTVIAPIVAIDANKYTVAIQDQKGNNKIVAVHDPRYQAMLPQMKKGDLVRLTLTEAVAVGILPTDLP